MMHFSTSITQYRNHCRFHREIRSFSRWLFSHSISSKSKKIALFCYLTWFLRFAICLHIETFIFMVSISLSITECSVTYNKVMNVQDFSEYMLKSSKCGPFWRLFYWPKMAEISNLLSHFNAMCDNIWKSQLKATICWVLSRALYTEAITLYVQSGYF